ncbi:hypothetical protein CCAX7_18560 [Capsulimonas corticalis]|uniref:Uncharacterized protein n=1 Tax=Capsulimonas corticalis TaxID=2219043 RepID=A0A402D5H5_9BACT|nr:hypothetical protein [Capsulimonas corticalis]BDI29805.1 hypothetical protein CCAX7_18560 [Capsulimonas corticalis]
MDRETAALIGRAAKRGLVTGIAAALLLVTVVGYFYRESISLFRQGAVVGLTIGIGIVIGGTILNIIVGLFDQTKNDIAGG